MALQRKRFVRELEAAETDVDVEKHCFFVRKPIKPLKRHVLMEELEKGFEMVRKDWLEFVEAAEKDFETRKQLGKQQAENGKTAHLPISADVKNMKNDFEKKIKGMDFDPGPCYLEKLKEYFKLLSKAHPKTAGAKQRQGEGQRREVHHGGRHAEGGLPKTDREKLKDTEARLTEALETIQKLQETNQKQEKIETKKQQKVED